MRVMQSLLKDEGGVALAEYALALGLIAIGSMLALAGIAVTCSIVFGNTSGAMQTFTTSAPP